MALRRKNSWPNSAPLAAASVLFALVAARGGETVECRVVSETPDGIHVDAGKEALLEVGSTGTVERNGVEIARVVVSSLSRSSALLKVLSTLGLQRPRIGDRVRLSSGPTAAAVGSPAEEGKKASPTLKEEGQEEEFVPLLAPLPGTGGTPPTRNILHGRLGLRQLFQIDPENHLEYSLTRFGSDGDVERLGGTPWAIDWSGDLSYRAGSAFSGTRDYEEPRLDVFRLSLFRKFERGGFLRLGRFLPPELAGVGYIDGAQSELVVAKSLRLGGIAGLKPGRIDLDPSLREPTGVAYATVEAGERRRLYYSGTVGVLGSLFEGKPDRLALLLDQRIDLGPKLGLYSTTEVDFDIGGAEIRSGTRLTRTDLYAVSPITSSLTLRAGLDHYERPDTRAERDILPFADERFFDRGYWRYWVGGSQNLPLKLRLDGEVALIDAPGEDYTPRWRAGLTRTGLPSLPQGQVSVTVYNLDGADAEGYGGLLSAYIPFLEGNLSLRPAAGFRLLETDTASEEFQITDLSLYGDYWISRTWSVYAGAVYSFGDFLGSTMVELGIDFRF